MRNKTLAILEKLSALGFKIDSYSAPDDFTDEELLYGEVSILIPRRGKPSIYNGKTDQYIFRC